MPIASLHGALTGVISEGIERGQVKVRRHIPVGASLVGLALVAASFLTADSTSGQGSAFLLEIGVGLGLVAVIFLIEKQMEERYDRKLDEAEERQAQKVDDAEERLERKIASATQEAGARAVAKVRQGQSRLAQDFFDNPTPAHLLSLANEAERLSLPRSVAVDLVDGWQLNVLAHQRQNVTGHDRHRVQLTLVPKASRKSSDNIRIIWTGEEPYEEMVERLFTEWTTSKYFPGQTGFDEINFIHLMTLGYTTKIDRKMQGGN